MADVHSKEIRSYNMSRIRGKNTKPEMQIRKFLFSKGFRYLLHDKRLPGKPDIVLSKYKTAIFVHGCFWHGHADCKYYIVPKTRTEWWVKKIDKNKTNDLVAEINIKMLGWKVINIWECDLKRSKIIQTLENLLLQITKINSN